jgi:hypothetical protein
METVLAKNHKESKADTEVKDGESNKEHEQAGAHQDNLISKHQVSHLPCLPFKLVLG